MFCTNLMFLYVSQNSKLPNKNCHVISHNKNAIKMSKDQRLTEVLVWTDKQAWKMHLHTCCLQTNFVDPIPTNTQGSPYNEKTQSFFLVM